MNILLVSATEAEIAPLLQQLQPYRVDEDANSYKTGEFIIHVCITGVGSVAATFHVQKYLSEDKVDVAIQAGIAGSFSRETVPVGSVWRIESDLFAGAGAEDNERFMDLFEMGLIGENEFPFEQKKLPAGLSGILLLDALPPANAITVHTVSGREATIRQWKDKYNPDLESMEGAAFHYVCRMEKIPFIQIRSISNLVEVRDKSKWDIPLAVAALNKVLKGWLDQLSLP